MWSSATISNCTCLQRIVVGGVAGKYDRDVGRRCKINREALRLLREASQSSTTIQRIGSLEMIAASRVLIHISQQIVLVNVTPRHVSVIECGWWITHGLEMMVNLQESDQSKINQHSGFIELNKNSINLRCLRMVLREWEFLLFYSLGFAEETNSRVSQQIIDWFVFFSSRKLLLTLVLSQKLNLINYACVVRIWNALIEKPSTTVFCRLLICKTGYATKVSF